MPYLIQRAIATVLLVLLGPLVIGLALAVRATSPGAAFHRATRVRPGGTFTLYKLRTMRSGAATAGPGVTAAGDPRVTRLGRILRRTKLDELPQLWNVVRGDMALVGPRPEDPRYVDLSDPLHVRVFGALPGITGPTAIAYRDEERILAAAAAEIARSHRRSAATPEDLDRAYREVVLPAKLTLDAQYLATRTLRRDLDTLIRTLWPESREPPESARRGVDVSEFTEWGGTAWSSMVATALEAIGDLDGLRILEVGARTGRMACLFALQGADVVAIDIDPGYVRAAEAEATRRGIRHKIHAAVDDGHLGSVADQTFDVVFTKSVLVVIPTREAYLRLVRDRLRPGGLIVAIENGRGGPIARILRKLRRTSWDQSKVDYFDAEDIAELSMLFRPLRIRRRSMPPIWLFVGRRG